jgi:hypothetical protein
VFTARYALDISLSNIIYMCVYIYIYIYIYIYNAVKSASSGSNKQHVKGQRRFVCSVRDWSNDGGCRRSVRN